jgi:hypothetical protein
MDKLAGVKFEQLGSSQYLAVSDKVIFLVYIDNMFLCVQDMEDVDKCIRNDLQNAGMMLEVEDNVARFLRGHIDCQDDGTSNQHDSSGSTIRQNNQSFVHGRCANEVNPSQTWISW